MFILKKKGTEERSRDENSNRNAALFSDTHCITGGKSNKNLCKNIPRDS